MKYFLPFLLLLFSCNSAPEPAKENADTANPAPAMNAETRALYDTLKLKDSLLFKIGYNHCDTNIVSALTSDDFEFYHDQGGIMESKAQFLGAIAGLCQTDYKVSRELEKNSLDVFPLYANGKLYGAVQNGKHQFFEESGTSPKRLTSTARFTHLWILENKQWKLKRVLSYDHVVERSN